MNLLHLITLISLPLVASATYGWKPIDSSQVPQALKQKEIRVVTADGEEVLDTNQVITIQTAKGKVCYMKAGNQWMVKFD